jgi:hypothetical protein
MSRPIACGLLATIAIIGGAPAAAFAATRNERSNGNASLTLTTCAAGQSPVTCHQQQVRIKMAFRSSCFAARTPSLRDKPFIGPESITRLGFAADVQLGSGIVDDGGHFSTENGVTIRWTGTRTGAASGTGHGTWTATGLPASCGGNGSASGTYESDWVEDGLKIDGNVLPCRLS